MMNGDINASALVNYPRITGKDKIKRSDFPKDFIFGSASSAYQVEGAWNRDGKGLSIWDSFTLRTPGRIDGGTNGSVAIDEYDMWKEDVALLKKVGLNSYRFSISWSRVLPGGRLSMGINKEGIKYYNDLIDLLVAEGIEPNVTIFHFDVPQSLEDEYGGFLSPLIVRDYRDFAELCFWEFGDRVKHWITLNEPSSFVTQGYAFGTWPPARGATSAGRVNATPNHRHRIGARGASSDGNPGTEPYIVAHHLILCHAIAVEVYRQAYQAHQGGKIGVTNVSQWFEPLNDTKADKEAVSRALDFSLGWFIAPLVTGDYPPVMRKLVGDRLPEFTSEQVNIVKGSYDFLGINYYTTYYVSNSPRERGTNLSYGTDQEVTTSVERDGNPIGPQAGASWLYIVPHGIHKLLVYIKNTFNNPVIYITENGVAEANNTSITVSEARFDEMRIKYHHDHLLYLKKAMDEGVNVKAYYIWSMFDSFEWTEGYSVRFGLFYVDYMNGRLRRFPKTSALWFMNFLDKKLQVYENVDHVNGVTYNSMNAEDSSQAIDKGDTDHPISVHSESEASHPAYKSPSPEASPRKSDATPSSQTSAKPKNLTSESNPKTRSIDRKTPSNRNLDSGSKDDKTGKRQNSSAVTNVDQEPRDSSSSNSGMQATESARAKVVANRSSPDVREKDIFTKKRRRSLSRVARIFRCAKF